MVPTSRPRYQITDTGSVAEMIDRAASQWPDTRDRKALLLRLAEAGAAQLDADRKAVDADARRARQVAAAARVRGRIDVDVLLSNDAWS